MEPNLSSLLIDYSKIIETHMSPYDSEVLSDGNSWYNRIFTSEYFRRAHFEIVNELEKHDVFLIHFCIFPKFEDPAPIFGMDFIYNKGKIVGAFHDFSPIAESKLNRWFAQSVEDVHITNRRILPAWGKSIFSENIISTGDITDVGELYDLLEKVMENLEYYLDTVASEIPKKPSKLYVKENNDYASFQKKNPHIKNMMLSFGYEEEKLNHFIETVLFPEYAYI